MHYSLNFMDWSHWPSEEVGDRAQKAAYRAAAHAALYQQVSVAAQQYGYDMALAYWRHQCALEMIDDSASQCAILQTHSAENNVAGMALKHFMPPGLHECTRSNAHSSVLALNEEARNKVKALSTDNQCLGFHGYSCVNKAMLKNKVRCKTCEAFTHMSKDDALAHASAGKKHVEGKHVVRLHAGFADMDENREDGKSFQVSRSIPRKMVNQKLPSCFASNAMCGAMIRVGVGKSSKKMS